MLLPGTHYVVYATNYMYVVHLLYMCTDMNRVHVMCTTGVSCTVATHIICILKITGALNIVTFCSRVDLVKV